MGFLTCVFKDERLIIDGEEHPNLYNFLESPVKKIKIIFLGKKSKLSG